MSFDSLPSSGKSLVSLISEWESALCLYLSNELIAIVYLKFEISMI